LLCISIGAPLICVAVCAVCVCVYVHRLAREKVTKIGCRVARAAACYICTYVHIYLWRTVCLAYVECVGFPIFRLASGKLEFFL